MQTIHDFRTAADECALRPIREFMRFPRKYMTGFGKARFSVVEHQSTELRILQERTAHIRQKLDDLTAILLHHELAELRFI